jgi:hypothetical protein
MSPKPSILHLGDPPRWHADLYKKLETHFTIIRPSAEERERPAFLQALREKRWGNFVAIMRPFWNTGGEMGRTDRELISLLPESVKVYGSAGAGFDWVDTDILAEHGKFLITRMSVCRTHHIPRDHLLQRRSSIFRLGGRCRTLPHHLHLPQLRLVANRRSLWQP